MSQERELRPDFKIPPILITVYNRPENIKLLIEAFRPHRPPYIAVASDGPKRDAEVELVRRAREAVKAIDWDCEVVRFFREENVGMQLNSHSAKLAIFKKYDSLIHFEDDCIPAEDFFDYIQTCSQLWMDDDRIAAFCGHNPIGYTPFSRQPIYATMRFRSWGHLIKRKHWIEFFHENHSSVLTFRDCVRESLRYPGIWTKLLKLRMLLYFRKELPKADIALNMFLGRHAYLVTVPSYNLVSNIGAGASATHTKVIPDLKFKNGRKQGFQNARPNEPQKIRRIEILDGWLILIWWIRSHLLPVNLNN